MAPDPFLGITELHTLLASRQCSASELCRSYLERIEALNPQLGCFLTVLADSALAAAEAADIRLARGDSSPLLGIPIAHKDLFCTRGAPTTCGSKILEGWHPPYDATVVERLAAAGAVVVGKCNMDEFAMGSSNENSAYGAVANPWDTSCVTGGSSGGSAACVAAGLVAASTGTDTGGSIRQPASLCGITGLRPTYGRVSRYGMIAFASSLDQAGPLTRSALDAACVLRAMAGFDARDSTSAERGVEDLDELLADACALPRQRLRVGIPREYLESLTSSDYQQAFDAARQELEAHGMRCMQVSLPSTYAAVPAYYVLACSEASSNLSRFDGVRYGHRTASADSLAALYQGSRSEAFGAEVKRRILTGTYCLSYGYYDAYYKKAMRVRRVLRDEFARAFEEVDLLITPSSPGVAFKRGALTDDHITMYQQDCFTTPAALAGQPSMSIPCGLSRGLPLGLQLIGPHFADALLLRVAHTYQQATDWHRRRPPIHCEHREPPDDRSDERSDE